MKITTIFSILTLSFVLCFGQEEGESIPFIADWAKGATYTYNITKIKQERRKGELSKDIKSTYTAKFTVLDSSESGYKISWKYTTDFSEMLPAELVSKNEKLYLTEIIYRTSPTGEFEEVENWKEVAASLKKTFEYLINELAKKNPEQAEILNKTMKPVLKIYDTQQGIEQLACKEVFLFHYPFGMEYSAKEPIFYEEELPNALGGAPIKGDAKIYLDGVDWHLSFCVLHQEVKLNPDDTRRVLTSFFKKMAIKDAEAAKAMESAKMDITDSKTYAFFFDIGLPQRIELKREVSMDINNEKGGSLELITIELAK